MSDDIAELLRSIPVENDPNGLLIYAPAFQASLWARVSALQALPPDQLKSVLASLVPKGGHRIRIIKAVNGWPAPMMQTQSVPAPAPYAGGEGYAAPFAPAPAPYGGSPAPSAVAQAVAVIPPGGAPTYGGGGAPAYGGGAPGVAHAVVITSHAGGAAPPQAGFGQPPGYQHQQQPAYQQPVPQPAYQPLQQLAPGTCKQCGVKPVHREADGRAHEFCGRGCAANAKQGVPPASAGGQLGMPPGAPAPIPQQYPQQHQQPAYQPQQQQQQPAPGICKQCGVKPVFREANGKAHEYCGRGCAANAKQGVPPAVSAQAAPAPTPAPAPAPAPHFAPGSPAAQFAAQQAAAASGGAPATGGGGGYGGGGSGGGYAPPAPAPAPAPVAAHGMCAFCTAKPQHPGFQYCGRGCSGAAGNAGWVNGRPPAPTQRFVSMQADLTQVFTVEKTGTGALMDRRWARIRAPLTAAGGGAAGYGPPPGQAMDVEWRLKALKPKKGQHVEVTVTLEPPGGGLGHQIEVQRLVSGGSELVGYASTTTSGEVVRLNIDALAGGSGGDVELSYKILPKPPTAAAAARPTAAAGGAPVGGWDYDHAAFDDLEQIVAQLTSGWDPKLKQPTIWQAVPPGIMVPFSDGVPAVEMCVHRKFTSKAEPYWVKFKDPGGNVTDTVMKAGDDLRQDQVVLGMLELFNTIWAREGVVHLLAGGRGGTEPVRAPLYRCMCSGMSRGFVEMLPRSTPVEDIAVAKSRGENGWRSSNEIVPSSVAGFMSIFLLDIRDRHQGNMIVTEANGEYAFANIDFGWVEEGPSVDTGRFPLPQGLRYLLDATKMKAEFYDLSFDAIRCLHIHQDEINHRWGEMLSQRGLNDRVLHHDVPARVRERMLIPRGELDKRLEGTTAESFNTWKKDFTHGLGAMMKA